MATSHMRISASALIHFYERACAFCHGPLWSAWCGWRLLDGRVLATMLKI